MGGRLQEIDLDDRVSVKWQSGLFVVYTALIALRYPWMLIHGRVWGEEGTVYLASAWSMGILKAILAPHQGYYALWPNLCGVLVAHVFPLAEAGLVLTWSAFLVQILAGYVVLRCETFSDLKTKALALAVLLLTTNLEVWLNTINSHFYLAVCAAVILVSRPERLVRLRNGVLLFAVMSGPEAVVLSPFFLLRAIVDKSRAAWVQAVVMCVPALVQAGIILRELHLQVRPTAFEPSGIAPEFLVRFLVRPFLSRLGETAASALILNQSNTFWLQRLHFHFQINWKTILIWGAVDLCFLGLLFWTSNGASKVATRWLLAMGVWLALFSMYGALGGTYQLEERYIFTSSVLIGLALTLVVGSRTTTVGKRLAAQLLLGCFLLAGTVDFFYYRSWVAHQRPDGPDWKQQAERWQRTADSQLTVWPKEWAGPVVRLSPKGPRR